MARQYLPMDLVPSILLTKYRHRQSRVGTRALVQAALPDKASWHTLAGTPATTLHVTKAITHRSNFCILSRSKTKIKEP